MQPLSLASKSSLHISAFLKTERFASFKVHPIRLSIQGEVKYSAMDKAIKKALEEAETDYATKDEL